MTIARRVDRIEAARLAAALTRLHAAWEAWGRPLSTAEALAIRARLDELDAALPPAERAAIAAAAEAMDALVEPGAPPAVVARAAAALAPAYGLPASATPAVVIDAITTALSRWPSPTLAAISAD